MELNALHLQSALAFLHMDRQQDWQRSPRKFNIADNHEYVTSPKTQRSAMFSTKIQVADNHGYIIQFQKTRKVGNVLHKSSM